MTSLRSGYIGAGASCPRKFRSLRYASAVLTLCGALAAHAQTVVTLPFETDFESEEGYGLGPLTTDTWWQLDSDLDAAIVEPGAGSSQALELFGANSLDLFADSDGAPVSWVDFYLKPVFVEPLQLPEVIETEQSAVTGFVKVDAQGEVYAIDGDTFGGGTWVPSGESSNLQGDTSEDWIRLTYRLDYATKTWDLFVDGEMVLTDLGFLDQTVPALGAFSLRADSERATQFDYFYAGDENPLYIDSSNDGLPDDWLTAQGLDIHSNQREGDADLDGLSNLLEYQLSTGATNPDSDGDGVHDGMEYRSAADPAAADAYELSPLPFLEDFESYSVGPLDPQGNWTTTGGSVAVQSADTWSGAHALELGVDSRASNLLDGAGSPVVWIDLHLKPTPYREAPELPEDTAVGYYFDTEGRPVVFDGSGGSGSGFWRLLDAAASDDWRRVTVKMDYAAQAYDFYLDGERLGAGLGFASAQPYLSRLAAEGSTLLDDVAASAAEPAALDDDRDGLTNSEEAAAGTDPLAFDSDGDGLADSLELLWGLDPNVPDAALAQPITEGSGALVWTTSFAADEGYAPGPLDGQNDWTAVGTAEISADETAALAESTTDAAFERLAGMGEAQRLWVSFRARLLVGELTSLDGSTEPFAAAFGASSATTLAIWDAAAADWTSVFNTTTDLAEWNDYALYLDYINKSWTLHLNGVIVAEDLPFRDGDLATFSRFKALQAKIDETGPDFDPGTAAFDDFRFADSEPADMDFDGDGLTNDAERQIGTDLRSADTDGDGLPDLWEHQHGLDPLAYDANEDPDGDGLVNADEYAFGFDPFVADLEGAPGFAVIDIWNGIEGPEVSRLTDDPRFPLDPDGRSVLTSLAYDFGPQYLSNYGQRIRGTVTAPVSGDYTFWIASDDHSELWLSEDETPFLRRRIASVPGATEPRQWTKYREQRSTQITLEAGQSYDFQILHKESDGGDHVAVAWQYPGQSRQVVPGEFLTTPTPHPNDQDEDGLPDDWESANGLDPAKGYSIDGAAGDFDGDGLSNLTEYHLGTDPGLTDTSGDGISDWDHVHILGTDPLLRIAYVEEETDSLPMSAVSPQIGNWTVEDGALVSGDIRGSFEQIIEIVEVGIYRLDVVVSQNNPYSLESTFKLRAILNGEDQGLKNGEGAYGETDVISWYLPQLPPGERTLQLDWLNSRAGSFLRIHDIRLVRLAEDPDAAPGSTFIGEAIHGSRSTVEDAEEVNYVSPFNLRGTSFAPAEVRIFSHPAGSPEAIQEETTQPALANSYFADIVLNPGEERVVHVDDQNGLRTESLSLSWDPFNLNSEEFIHIRLNDSLLLAADHPEGDAIDGITFTLRAPDGVTETFSLTPGAQLQALFDQAGDWTCEALLEPADGSEPVLVEADVRVSSAVLEPLPLLFVGRDASWTPDLSEDVHIETDEGLRLWEVPTAGDSRRFTLSVLNGESARFVARLPENGAILAAAARRPIFDYLRSHSSHQVVETFDDGTVLVRAFLDLSEVPDDFSATIHIFKNGVTFADGTIHRTVTAEDFDELGRYTFHMLRAPGVTGGNCHRITYSQLAQ